MKDQERESGLAETFLEEFIRLHRASIQELSSWGRMRCGAQRVVQRWTFLPGTSGLEEGSRWVALPGSDQEASLRDRFLHLKAGQGLQRTGSRRARAFAKGSQGDHCHVAKPAKENSTRRTMALSSSVVRSQIQVDSNDKLQSHLHCTPMKLMLKNELQVNFQIP